MRYWSVQDSEYYNFQFDHNVVQGVPKKTTTPPFRISPNILIHPWLLSQQRSEAELLAGKQPSPCNLLIASFHLFFLVLCDEHHQRIILGSRGGKLIFLRKSRSLSRKPVTPEYVTAVVSLALPRVLSKNDSRRRLFVAAEVITSKIVSLTIRAVRSVLGKMDMTVNVCSAKPKDGKIMFPVPGGPKKVPIFAALGIGRRDTRHTSKVSLERPYLSDSSVLKISSSIAHNKFLLIIFVWWIWTENIKTNKCFLTNLLLLA